MEAISEELMLFRDTYAPNLEIDDPKLFFMMLEKLRELKEGQQPG